MSAFISLCILLSEGLRGPYQVEADVFLLICVIIQNCSTCIYIRTYIYIYGCCPKFLVPEMANFTRKTFPFAKLSRNHRRA